MRRDEQGIADPAAATDDQCASLRFAIASAETDWYVAGPGSVTECALTSPESDAGDADLNCEVDLSSPPCR